MRISKWSVFPVGLLVGLCAIACTGTGVKPEQTASPSDPLKEIANILLPTSTPTTDTPTVVPTPASSPSASLTPSYGPAKLVLVAYSGQTAPGSDGDTFNGFDAPVISSNGLPFTSSDHKTIVGFFGYGSAALPGVWMFEPDDLVDGLLEPLAVPGQSFANAYIRGEWIGAMSEDINAWSGESIGFRGRYRNDRDEFVDGIFYRFSSGAVFELALEGPISNSTFADQVFTQFDAFAYGAPDVIYFRSPVSGDTIWRGHGNPVTVVLRERQVLEDLSAGWSVTAGNNLQLAGTSRDAAVIRIEDARYTLTDGSETKLDSGIWYFATTNGTSERVAVFGKDIPGMTATWGAIRDVTFSGEDIPVVGYVADYNLTEGTATRGLQTGVWKWDYQTVKTNLVSKSGDSFDIDGSTAQDLRELDSLGNAVVGTDGRLVFAAGTWTQAIDRIGLLIKEGSNSELKLLARTDQLPGSKLLETFGAMQITEIAVNKSGDVAFVLGTGEALWTVSAAGQTLKVVEKNDQLQIVGQSKTVEFIDFIGGSNTTSGLPSGLSDNGEIVFRAQFSDGTSAIYYTTFISD